MAKDNSKPQEPTKPEMTISGLGDLPDRETPVRIELDDRILLVPCKRLTYKQFQDLGRLVVDPDPPANAGRDGIKYDTKNPDYLRKAQIANERRLYTRLAAFVQWDIPGETYPEKGDYLAENVEFTILQALAAAMGTSMMEGRASIDARAATFHANGVGETENL